MKNVAVYYRVSTDKQDIASQQGAIETWLEQLHPDKQPKTIQYFTDEGISGKTDERPAFKKMIDQAYAGRIDTIIVYRLDRFSRNATSAIRMLLNLDEVGVAFISITQPVLNLSHENPFRRTMLAAFAEIAELERTTIVARVVAGLQAARKRGVELGPPRKITAEVREQIQNLRQHGKTIRVIAQELNLSTGAISKILRQDNPAISEAKSE
jgi:DNA invertase Pin-like site-specific DNA recombinase